MILNVRSCFHSFTHLTQFTSLHFTFMFIMIYKHVRCMFIHILLFYVFILYIICYTYLCTWMCGFFLLSGVSETCVFTHKEILPLLFLRFFTFNSIKSCLIWMGLKWNNAKSWKLFCLILNVNRVWGRNSLCWII